MLLTQLCLPSVPDPRFLFLQDRATLRQYQARAPGTHRNHKTGAATYIAFMRWAGLNLVSPSPSTVCVYIEYLSLHMPAPATVRNYISHARIHLILAEHVTLPLSDPRVSRALDGLDRTKEHTPKEKPPLPMQVLRGIITALEDTPVDRVVKAAYLLMYYAALRQSEVAPPSVKGFRSTSHLTRGDISFSGPNMTVNIRSGKNLQKCSQHKKVDLAPSPDKNLCVIAAMLQVIMDTPTEAPTEPCFMFPVERTPMPVTFLNKRWNEIFSDLGIPHRDYTLHGLRVTAASVAFQAGVPELDIQRYGGWRSQAHRTYIKAKALTGVNKSLIQSLART